MSKKKILEWFCELIATGFYVGYIPKCPGSVSSFFTVLLIFFLPQISVLYSFLITIILFFLGVFVSGNVAFNVNQHDPSKIVIDEIVGMWISLLMLPKVIWIYGLAFVLFRFFDISKILFINRLEKLPRGWGIMMDDVLAGIFTVGSIYFIKFFVGF